MPRRAEADQARDRRAGPVVAAHALADDVRDLGMQPQLRPMADAPREATHPAVAPASGRFVSVLTVPDACLVSFAFHACFHPRRFEVRGAWFPLEDAHAYNPRSDGHSCFSLAIR